MKSRWNWGSITCIICFTCVGSQLSMSSSKASNFSGPLQLYQRGIGHITNSYKRPASPCMAMFEQWNHGQKPLKRLQVLVSASLLSNFPKKH
uniref:Dual endothelin 1/angiotensin II receptor 1 homolog (Rat) n=1 Tax=Mus musculus TaxID=10090 RepID=B2RUM2_MOUSE|nr:Dual endothelin 1/angiotensin II receptor 1 homolog (rat) [Mus musculus]AAI60338.1 Dual endothelin 1/angiotensin II receptor 1 homolog (rat) [synthetic construct]|eukprot:NP_001035551.2 dual endothelin 1/angiotensin II receptor 1 homolog precursor [Mus musculus]